MLIFSPSRLVPLGVFWLNSEFILWRLSFVDFRMKADRNPSAMIQNAYFDHNMCSTVGKRKKHHMDADKIKKKGKLSTKVNMPTS